MNRFGLIYLAWNGFIDASPDVDLVVQQAGCSRSKAVKALKDNNNGANIFECGGDLVF